MKQTLFISLLLFSQIANADCLDDSQNGQAVANLSWLAATHRTDESLFQDSDNGGYKVYYTDTSDGTPCSRLIPDKTVLNTSFNVHLDRQHNFNMTQFDIDGRESAFSTTVVINIGKTIIPIGNPAYPEFTLTRVGNTLDYILDFADVTTYDNGNLLPTPPVKYYLFERDALGSYKWIDDIPYSEIPLTMTLDIGEHYYVMEAEIIVNNQLSVSAKSPATLVNVQEYVVPDPKAVNEFKITVPDGFDLIINFVPK